MVVYEKNFIGWDMSRCQKSRDPCFHQLMRPPLHIPPWMLDWQMIYQWSQQTNTNVKLKYIYVLDYPLIYMEYLIIQYLNVHNTIIKLIMYIILNKNIIIQYIYYRVCMHFVYYILLYTVYCVFTSHHSNMLIL